jgi:hypothetical protein
MDRYVGKLSHAREVFELTAHDIAAPHGSHQHGLIHDRPELHGLVRVK